MNEPNPFKHLAEKLKEFEIAIPQQLSPEEVSRWVGGLRSIFIHRPTKVSAIETALRESAKKLESLILLATRDSVEHSQSLVYRFFDKLPGVEKKIRQDVEAAMAGDPAAKSLEEIVLSYPSIVALISHRIAHELFLLDVPLLPRLISEIAHSSSGIDIHPGAQIGSEVFIDHGTGVVIGETAIIGNRVRLYQGVTLGAKSFPVDETGKVIKDIPRHPIVEDDVVIYSGATILGRITIGKGSMIGGNVWLTRDVPPYSRVIQGNLKQERFEGHGDGI